MHFGPTDHIVKISLRAVTPEVWRRVQLPSDTVSPDVVVERVDSATDGSTPPTCLDGEHAYPPEDCGGPGGYAGFLEAIGDPKHADHQQMIDWVGGPFDPTEFDRDAINRAVRLLVSRRRR